MKTPGSKPPDHLLAGREKTVFVLMLCLAVTVSLGIAFRYPVAAFNNDEEPIVDEKLENVLINDQTLNDGVRFILSSHGTIEATVTLRCSQLDNLESSHKLPYQFLVDRPYDKIEILRFRQRAPGEWQYGSYSYRYKMGRPSDLQPIDFVYRLPYAGRHQVTQGYFGKFSHQRGSESEFAVDFSMPEGTLVLAARPGTVVALRWDSNMGGPSTKYMHCENFVIVKHEDGTYGDYAHFKYGGVLVKLGQSVQAGTPIGLSGNTGFTSLPHLHFEIYKVISGEMTRSLPFKMLTYKGVMPQLIEGEFY